MSGPPPNIKQSELAERGLPGYSIYWEKVRMGLQALATHEWALWVDDDATINQPDVAAEEWFVRLPGRGLLVAPQPELEDHGVRAAHYHNWGVWLVRRDAWSVALLQQMLDPAGRCADLHRECMMPVSQRMETTGPGSNIEVRCSNPEQDCFVRFMHDVRQAPQLSYPFVELGRDLDTLPLNRTTLARLGEPDAMGFNCICQLGRTCRRAAPPRPRWYTPRTRARPAVRRPRRVQSSALFSWQAMVSPLYGENARPGADGDAPAS